MSSCNLKQLWALAWLFPKITEKHVLQLFANGFQLNDSGLQQCLPDLCHWFALTESEVARRWSQCAEEFSLLMSMGANLLTPSCDGYPAKLKFRCSRPPVLSVSGDPSLLSLRGLAVVGSRKVSPASRAWLEGELSKALVSEKAKQNLCVISGGAMGVDQLAHQLALLSGVPCLCVAPVGLAKLYPKSLIHLANVIRDRGGLLVSPFRPSQTVRKSLFASRNFVLANLANLLFVVQAEKRSGSLMSAQLAAKSGVEVAALAGAAGDALSAGSLDLIYDGALMIRTGSDLNLALNVAGNSRP